VCPLIAGGQSASYKVRLDLDRPLRATVEAELEAPKGLLFTAEHAGGYAWWDFIKNLRQVREDGSSVPLQPAGQGCWTFPHHNRRARAAKLQGGFVIYGKREGRRSSWRPMLCRLVVSGQSRAFCNEPDPEMSNSMCRYRSPSSRLGKKPTTVVFTAPTRDPDKKERQKNGASSPCLKSLWCGPTQFSIRCIPGSTGLSLRGGRLVEP
jgi:hypothetical protein